MAGTTARIVLTMRDDGRRVRLRPGQTAQLLVQDMQAPEPQIDGDAIVLMEVSNVAASGRRQWEIRAVAIGTSRITVGGRQPFTVEVEVQSP